MRKPFDERFLILVRRAWRQSSRIIDLTYLHGFENETSDISRSRVPLISFYGIHYMTRFISLLLLCYLVIACAHKHSPSIPVELGERQTLYFTGKGAAAGIMMDAYLGGAGVAIGIAIDEGIAKDISAAIQKSNPEFDIRDLVKKQLVVVSDEVVTKNWQSIVIERYGFQSAAEDKVLPLLKFQLICKSQTAHKIEFSPDENDAISFDRAKTDGALAEKKINKAVEKLFDKQDFPICEL